MEKEVILQAFENLGFDLHTDDDEFFFLEYEGMTYLYQYLDGDEYYFRLAIPAIYELSKAEDCGLVSLTLNRAHQMVKYAKFVIYRDMVWAEFEYPMMKGIDVEEVIEFGIKMLQATAETVSRVLQGVDSEFDEDGEGEQ